MTDFPIKKNQDIPLTITSLTAEGSGVGHYAGVAVFVPNTAVCDEIECHIIKTKKNYAIGKVKSIVKPSEDRISSDCSVFEKCGGCVFRHISYEAECKIKKQRVADAFSRIGHIDISPEEIIAADSIDRYRNKAQYPTRLENGNIAIGFFAQNSHRVVSCRDCLLQPSEFSAILDVFENWIKENNVPLYNEENHTGLLRHIYLRKAFATGEIMVCAVINGSSLPSQDRLVSSLLNECNTIKSITVNENTQRTNVILGKNTRVIYGREYIEDIICGIKIRISPASFYQVNRTQAEKLYTKAAEYAEIGKDDILLDLYCGAGTIGLTMAKQVKKLIGVEIIPEAVEDAKINAEINGITNAEFICADAPKAAEMLRARGIKPSVIIVDPPRKGCARELLETITQMRPARIVYISCDPATLARDCAILAEKGYKTQKAAPTDMFPRTAHVETVCILSKLKSTHHIEVEIELDKMDLTKAESKATYAEIKEYVLDKYDLKVSQLYIAQVKRKHGIIERINYNIGEGKNRVPQVTPEKEAAIEDALRHFKMIE